MTSDRNRPGFGPAFWAGIALAIPAHGQSAMPPCAEVARARPPVRAWIERLVGTVVLWHERARQRRAAMDLSDRTLRDIGLTRLDIAAEAHKPFWRA